MPAPLLSINDPRSAHAHLSRMAPRYHPQIRTLYFCNSEHLHKTAQGPFDFDDVGKPGHKSMGWGCSSWLWDMGYGLGALCHVAHQIKFLCLIVGLNFIM